jgi:hypothetical protein
VRRAIAVTLAAVAIAGLAVAGDEVLLFGPRRWTYLLRDLFTTDLRPASLHNATFDASPGPGTWKGYDSASHAEITGGNFVTDGGALAHGDPEIQSGAITHAAGKAMVARINSFASAGGIGFGPDANPPNFLSVAAAYQPFGMSGSLICYDTGDSLTTPGATAIVLRSGGGGFMVDVATQTLRFVQPTGTVVTPVYAAISNYNATMSVDWLRVVTLTDFDTDADFYSGYSASPSVGTEVTAESDLILDFVVDYTTPAETRVMYRRVDDNNGFVVRTDSSDGSIAVHSVTGGSLSYLCGSAAGVLTGSHRIMVIADGTEHRLFVQQSGAMVMVDNDTSSLYQSATGVKLVAEGAPVTDLYAWRRDLTTFPTESQLLAMTAEFDEDFSVGQMSSPRTCEPGPGTLTVTDTGGHLSISGGALVADGGTGSWGDPAVFGGGVSATNGRAFLCDISHNAAGLFAVGVGSSPAGLPDTYWYYSNSTNLYCINSLVASITSGDLDVAVVLGSNRGYFLRKVSGVWTMDWVQTGTNPATIYPGVSSYNSSCSFDNLRVVDIPSWSSDDKIYTDYEASPTATTTGSHTADCLLEWTQTTVARCSQRRWRSTGGCRTP